MEGQAESGGHGLPKVMGPVLVDDRPAQRKHILQGGLLMNSIAHTNAREDQPPGNDIKLIDATPLDASPTRPMWQPTTRLTGQQCCDAVFGLDENSTRLEYEISCHDTTNDYDPCKRCCAMRK